MKPARALVWPLALATLALALLFVLFVDRQVFDDGSSLRDILRYEREGVTTASLRNHVNPAGPYAYALIGVVGRTLGGSLQAFRLVVWANAAGALLLLHLWGRRSAAATGGLVLLLANPYLPLASATLLTEIPSLLALMLGLFLWLRAMPGMVSGRRAIEMAAGALLVGLSITGRQYYIAAVPAMGLAFLWTFWQRRRWPNLAAWAILTLSLALATLPLAMLTALWGGLTSPGMRNGQSYATFHAGVGLNILRPLTASLYIGTVAVFPLALQRRAPRRLLTFAVAAAMVALLVAIAVRGDDLWCQAATAEVSCGPISQMVRAATRHGSLTALGGNWLAALVGVFGMLLLADAAITRRDVLRVNLPAAFSLLFIVMFVVEQAFVGGNIAFYERYVLQVSPFIGMLAAADGSFSTGRALLGSIPSLIAGQARLWRL